MLSEAKIVSNHIIFKSSHHYVNSTFYTADCVYYCFCHVLQLQEAWSFSLPVLYKLHYANVKIKWTWVLVAFIPKSVFYVTKTQPCMQRWSCEPESLWFCSFCYQRYYLKKFGLLMMVIKKNCTNQSKPVRTSLEVHEDVNWSFSRDNSRLLCHMQEFLE